MNTISIPISSVQEGHIKTLIKKGFAKTKAAVLRRVFNRFVEKGDICSCEKFDSLRMSKREFNQSLHRAEEEAARGKILYGNLGDLVRQV